MFWVLHSGAQWRDLPERYGRWQTIYGRYRRRVGDGLFDAMRRSPHLQLDEQGRIDWSVFDIDGSSIRAHRAATGASSTPKEKT